MEHERITTTVKFIVEPDDSPDTSYLEQPELEDRLKEYENNQFEFVGVYAQVSQHNWITGVTKIIRSAGVWGIESDSDDAYLIEIGQDELSFIKLDVEDSRIDISGIEPKLVR